MSPWTNLERISLRHARRQNLAAQHFGVPHPVGAGRQTYLLQFAPCRAGYPLRLHGRAGGAALTLDCDAQALFPELAWQSLIQTRANAHALIAQAFANWLSALEGLFGFAIDISGISSEVRPQPGACGLVLTHAMSRRAAYFALDCEAVDQWLQRQPAPAGDTTRLARHLQMPMPVCRSGPMLTLPGLLRIQRGDVLLLDRSSLYLRVSLGRGARRISLKRSGEHMVVDGPMTDDFAESAAAPGELIPMSALRFSFDAVIGTLSLSVDELTRLRTGSIVPLQVPANGSSVLLLCQGVPFARGQLVDVDNVLGVRLVDLKHLTGNPSAS